MNPLNMVLIAAGVVIVGEWSAGNNASTLVKEGVILPGGKKASGGTILVGGFISALMISIAYDAGGNWATLAKGFAALILVSAILGPGTAIFKKLGIA